MISIVIVVAVLVLQVSLGAFAMRLGTRWAKVEKRGWVRCALGYFTVVVCGTIGFELFSRMLVLPENPMRSAVIAVILLAISVYGLAMIAGAALVFCGGFLASIKVAACAFGALLVMAGLMFGLLRPFVIEAYVSPTMGMAPAIRGVHFINECQACGGDAIVGVQQASGPLGASSMPGPRICASCYASSMTSNMNMTKQSIQGADRFVVNKLHSPGRWDITAYRTVDNSSIIFVQRVVGLPGETIQLAGGKVLINGQPVTPPEDCAKVRFGDVLPMLTEPMLAVNQPLQLKPNEYFLLGDNQSFSMDCRFTGPVPAGNIVGVAELVYWPVTRFGLLH